MTADQIMGLAAVIADLRLQVATLAADNQRLAAENARLEAPTTSPDGLGDA